MAKWFKIDEFDCPCCGQNWTQLDLVNALDNLRDDFGFPISVTSGYRCKKHNAEVGGVAGSQHVEGRAADLHAADLNKLYAACCQVFSAVGDGRHLGFVHVDLRNDKIRRWTY